jgi:hypothetical protein
MPMIKEIILIIVLHNAVVQCQDTAMMEAMDATLSLLSGSSTPSNNTLCTQNIRELMIRNSITPSADFLRNNLTDSQLLRLGILASIALISPWNQDSQGKFVISDRGILVEDYHPSSSESDIMLCVTCTLLAIIVLFHVTSAQHHYVTSPETASASTNNAMKT